MRRPTRHTSAFTLTEILIALGLFAVAVTGLLALFPHMQRTAREGEDEARAALIAGNILDAVTLSASPGMFSLATGISGRSLRFETLDPLDPRPHHVLYGGDCEPIRSLTEDQEGQSVPDQSATDVATLRLSTKKSLPALVVAEVAVAGPASAPPSGRSIRRFVRLVPLPRHD